MSLNTHLSSDQSVDLVVSASAHRPLRRERKHSFSLVMLPMLLTVSGLGAIASPTQAQTAGSLTYDRDTGSVQIDNNAFDIQTGPLKNTSDIPLPDGLPTQVQDRVSQPVFSDRLAPNSIELSPDVDYVNRSLGGLLSEQRPDAGYDLQAESLKFTTQFNLAYSEGNHAYGEGIQVTVLGANGEVISRQSGFVRGYRVSKGPNGEDLPESVQLDVDYGPTERVELRVLNIRSNGAEPSESGIYFSQDGELIVEDLQNGGDRDFNDGNYVEFSGGRGEAVTLEERENITYETRVSEVPLILRFGERKWLRRR